METLKKMIREVPDFPKPGINFYDITTLLKHPDGLRKTVDALAAEYDGEKVDTVIGVEARGFIFAPALAYHLGAGFVPVRKPNKLPAATDVGPGKIFCRTPTSCELDIGTPVSLRYKIDPAALPAAAD